MAIRLTTPPEVGRQAETPANDRAILPVPLHLVPSHVIVIRFAIKGRLECIAPKTEDWCSAQQNRIPGRRIGK